MAKKSLNDQVEEIMRLAEEKGVQSNFLFATTFERYLTQINIASELKKILKEEGMIVSKEYVKGRKNLYCNPAVAEYNRTTDSANKTAATLMKIIKNFSEDENGDGIEEDPLMKIINGGDGDAV